MSMSASSSDTNLFPFPCACFRGHIHDDLCEWFVFSTLTARPQCPATCTTALSCRRVSVSAPWRDWQTSSRSPSSSYRNVRVSRRRLCCMAPYGLPLGLACRKQLAARPAKVDGLPRLSLLEDIPLMHLRYILSNYFFSSGFTFLHFFLAAC